MLINCFNCCLFVYNDFVASVIQSATARTATQKHTHTQLLFIAIWMSRKVNVCKLWAVFAVQTKLYGWLLLLMFMFYNSIWMFCSWIVCTFCRVLACQWSAVPSAWIVCYEWTTMILTLWKLSQSFNHQLVAVCRRGKKVWFVCEEQHRKRTNSRNSNNNNINQNIQREREAKE